MKLSELQISAIKKEYHEFADFQYSGKSTEERQALGQFFTPPGITIKMIEKFESFNPDDTLLDPTMGAGGLLAACIVAGLVKPENCYGIELDSDIYNTAKERLTRIGVPAIHFTKGEHNHFYLGDALKRESYDFPLHKEKYLPNFGDYIGLFD